MIEMFYEKLDVPESCSLGKRLFKRMFYENAQLNATDKKAFSEDIEEIVWHYTLKPETIGIPRYEDDDREYHEVAIIQVNLKRPGRYKRIAEIMQRAIPYPMMIVFVEESRIALSLADKRINRADKEKIVVEQFHLTDWFNLEDPAQFEADFLKSCSVKSFSYNHFYDFYSDLIRCVVALQCATHSGSFTLAGDKQKTTDVRLEDLAEIERLQQERTTLKEKLKKEKNLGTQVQLNTQVKRITDQINSIKARI